MRLTLRNIIVLAIITVAGVAGSTVVGLMIYGAGIFDLKSPGFSFVAYGLGGGFIFAFYHVRGLSETITTSAVVSAVQFGIASLWITPLNAAIWSFGVNAPVVILAFLFERKLSYLHQAKFVGVGLLYGAMFVILTLVCGLLIGLHQMPAVIFRQNFVDGFMIGLGLGVGVQLGESFVHSIQHHRAEQRALALNATMRDVVSPSQPRKKEEEVL
jgi:hypothetical protein